MNITFTSFGKSALAIALTAQMAFPASIWAADAAPTTREQLNSQMSQAQDQLLKAEAELSATGMKLYTMDGTPTNFTNLFASGATEYKAVSKLTNDQSLTLVVQSQISAETLSSGKSMVKLSAFDGADTSGAAIGRTSVKLDTKASPAALNLAFKQNTQAFANQITSHFSGLTGKNSQSVIQRIVSLMIPSAHAEDGVITKTICSLVAVAVSGGIYAGALLVAKHTLGELDGCVVFIVGIFGLFALLSARFGNPNSRSNTISASSARPSRLQ